MPRTDFITASRVDLTLILLPTITWLEASCMLASMRRAVGGGHPVLALRGAPAALALQMAVKAYPALVHRSDLLLGISKPVYICRRIPYPAFVNFI